MENYTGIWQGPRGGLAASSWLLGWICDALNTWPISSWCRTAGARSGTCSFFTQSHSEGSQIFGLGIFLCGCPQGDKAGWKNLIFWCISKCWDSLPVVGTFYGK